MVSGVCGVYGDLIKILGNSIFYLLKEAYSLRWVCLT